MFSGPCPSTCFGGSSESAAATKIILERYFTESQFRDFPKERIMTEVKPMTTKPDPSAATTSEKKTEISPEVEAKAKEMFESLHGHPTWEAFEGKEAYYEQVKQAAEAKTADQSASQPKK